MDPAISNSTLSVILLDSWLDLISGIMSKEHKKTIEITVEI